MDKTQQKVTKDPKRQEAVCREKYIKKLKESILNDTKKMVKILTMKAIMLPMPPICCRVAIEWRSIL